MLTKTLRFDDDVLDVLKQMSWSDDGLLGKLNGQLDRKLYERTNKALEAMGGKWNRKQGGHVFAYDPRSQVEGLLGSGTLEVARDGFFRTPRNVLARMLELCPLPPEKENWNNLILEPEAGDGAIVEFLIENGADWKNIYCVEKNEQRYQILREKGIACEVSCQDFLSYMDYGWMRIYMNPPFEESQDIKHVMHAYSLLDPDGGEMVSVMGEGAFFRGDRIASEFRDWLKDIKHDGCEVHVEELPDGSFKESGTMTRARLVHIIKREV